MMSSYHRNWFPLILIGLTLILLFGVLLVMGPAADREDIINEPDPVITEAEYQAHLKVTVNTLVIGIETVETDQQKAKLVRDAQSQVLALVLPASQKENHLELVIAMNLMASGYEHSDQELVTEGRSRFDLYIEQNDWLK